MILVDTSVFVDYFSGTPSEGANKLDDIISRNIPFGINAFIYQELLQDVSSEQQFDELKRYLDTQRFVTLADERESYAKAARIYYKCRKAGFTIRSAIDLLIAVTAIERNLALLHKDSDFLYIQKVAPQLKFF